MSIFKQISRLAQHSAIYAVSTAVQKLSGFLLLPVFTNPAYIASTQNFGDYVLITTFIGFMYFFYTYGMDSALLRYFFLGDSDRKTVVSTTVVVLLVTSLTTTILILMFSEQLSLWIMKSPGYVSYMKIAAFILLFDALGNLGYLILRAEERSILFSIFRIARFLLEMGFNIYFVVFQKAGVMGILYTFLIASFLNLLAMLPILWPYLGLRFKPQLAKQMLSFGLPLLPHGLAYATIEMIDRFLLPELLDKDALGVYGANYKFGILLLFLVNAFKTAWQPFFLKIAKQNNAREIYSRVLTYFVIGAGLIVLFGSLFLENLLRIRWFGEFYFLNPPFWGGISIIPIILVSYIFYGIYVILTPGFYITKKSNYMILFTGSGALVNIVSNLYLLPRMGFEGAAWATLISYLAMALSIYVISNRIYPIHIEWRRIAITLFSLITLMVTVHYASPSLFVKILIAAASVILSYRFLLTLDEKQPVLQALRRLQKGRQP